MHVIRMIQAFALVAVGDRGNTRNTQGHDQPQRTGHKVCTKRLTTLVGRVRLPRIDGTCCA